MQKKINLALFLWMKLMPLEVDGFQKEQALIEKFKEL